MDPADGSIDIVMEVCFNELSVEPYCTNGEEIDRRVGEYVQVVKAALELGAKKIRYEHGLGSVSLTEEISLAQYCFDKRNNKIWSDFLLSCVKKPYIEDGSETEVDFISYDDVKLKKNDTFLDCFGLYSAYLYKSYCIGFCSEDFWRNVFFTLRLVKGRKITEQQIVCISEEGAFNEEPFAEWCINNISIPVLESNLLPCKKEIKLRDDHGKDKLMVFAERLVQSPYIKKVIGSLPFNPTETKFIHNLYNDGRIELVLTDTDQGLGLVVQTTGRNLLETKWIAKYLMKKFC